MSWWKTLIATARRFCGSKPLPSPRKINTHAPPPQQADIAGDRNITVQTYGSDINVTINANEHHLSLTLHSDRTLLAHSAASDAALLSAYRTDVVPLIGREEELADLWRWMA